MKKMMILLVAAASVCAWAGPHHGGPGSFRGMPGGFRGGHYHPPAFHHGPAPHHHHHGYWGSGGRYFWPGFVGGVVGGLAYNSLAYRSPVVVTTPTVVAPTVVTTTPAVVAPVTQVQSVWVEGRYVDQVQANGVVVRTWQPGHYEQQTVVVQ